MERETVAGKDMFGHGDEAAGYDAVVIGSGYGGSVAACRMSMAGIKVCLMEKGGKWESQDFPTNSVRIMSAVKIENRKWGFSFGRKEALIQYVFLMALLHKSLSLAGVESRVWLHSLYSSSSCLRAWRRLTSECWSDGIDSSTCKKEQEMAKGLGKNWEVCEAAASTMLRAQSVPVEFPNAKVMRGVVQEEIEECSPSSMKLSINFDKEDSADSMGSCLACGNCLSGCPYNAKNSTDKNYLVSAVGCTIKTECQVQYVVRNSDEGCEETEGLDKKLKRRWRVYSNDIDYVLCDFVVISAGVLGTTDILFQSERRGLHVSEKLGFGFSCNGNSCAYLAGSSAPLGAYGLDKNQFSNIPFQDRPGPAISTSYTSSLGFTIQFPAQSAVLPTSFPYLLFKGIQTYGWPNGFWFLHGLIDKLNHMFGLKAGQAMVFNVMGYDDSDGKITLEKGTDKICFSPPRDPILPRKIQALQKLTKRIGGILFMSRHRSTSVHLLGGCNAASDPSNGVCDPNGQVFNSKCSPTVHKGLYVCDASLIPCSIGINPCLTIATVAEHVSRNLVLDVLKHKNSTAPQLNMKKEQHYVDKQCTSTLDEAVVPKPEVRVSRSLEAEQRSHLLVKETMRGYIGGMPCTAHLIMKMNSSYHQSSTIGESDPLLRGKVGGCVIFEAVEKDKLYIVNGKVDMCQVDNRTPYTQYMHYHLVLASASGSRYILEGKKIMNPYLLYTYAWSESTTLHVTFRTLGQQSSKEQKIDLKGELSLSFLDLLRSLIGLKGNVKGRFICLLLRSLLRTYIQQTPRGSHSGFSPSDLRERPYPPSTLHKIKTEDGAIITCRQWKCKQDLWKNEGYNQNPVLLINGYSGESYWLPTEPNDLIRTLLENDQEAWLLQSRLHPSHPSNEFTVEDIGKFDIPAVHIALMGGHVSATNIASLCCTNSSMFFKITTSSLVKMKLPLIPISMGILGKERILPMFRNSESSLPHRLLKYIARLIPRCERCAYDECEVFSGIFGNAFWHDNVSSSMHHWLCKLNISKLPMSAFPHIRKICTTGHIVDHAGKNQYLIHPERMATHTLYLSGGRSLLVTPQTSFLAHQYMKLHQPGFRHSRVVVDGFGHSDLLIGEESYKKVFPHIISHITTIEEGRNRVVCTKEESNFKTESLSWAWDNDPCEASKCGLSRIVSCSATENSSGDKSSSFCIIEGPETVQDFVQMQMKEIQDNIKSRRNKIFLLMEEVRRLRVQKRIKRTKVIDEISEEADEMPDIPSSIPFLPHVTKTTLKKLYLTSFSFISGIIVFGGLLAPVLELKLGIGGTSYEDFIRNMHLPMQLRIFELVDPIVASFSGGAVGVISALMLIEVNNVEQQEKKRCKYCHGTGYLACARCSASGVCLSIEPISIACGSDRPLRAPTTQRCINCSGAGKVMCPTCLCTGMVMASEHDLRIDPFD
ncbi:hypothetical protein IFM89_030984 [Coptis chinensis]|uniref:Cholesterol oxidase n=1 Tax=Coptis chinensis TaxID=261450 RepID=A0A835LJ57_9MAGN|nr:hypothetical protein IFM89_030984 [Coptis chinensis]